LDVAEPEYPGGLITNTLENVNSFIMEDVEEIKIISRARKLVKKYVDQ